MVKLKDLLNEYGKKTSELVGTPKKVFGQIHNMKEDMKSGKFDPKNPQVHIHGFGVYTLKTLEKAIARDLKECINKDAEFTAMKLYSKHSTTEAKVIKLPSGHKVKIEFKGLTFAATRGKDVFLDRSELMKFFQATSRYLK